MTIKEVEILLDIPRATIRFYEKEGLVEPIREENGYRAYSEEDVEMLISVPMYFLGKKYEWIRNNRIFALIIITSILLLILFVIYKIWG